jgi:hypothetical protein
LNQLDIGVYKYTNKSNRNRGKKALRKIPKNEKNRAYAKCATKRGLQQKETNKSGPTNF